MSRAHKVFSKHNSKEVREWSRQLMKSYQLLHAIEKPMNLDFVKPFANTSDLKEFAPNIDFNLAEERKKEREFKLKKNQKNDDDDPNIVIDMEKTQKPEENKD